MEVAPILILIGLMFGLILLGTPVAFALIFAAFPVILMEPRLQIAMVAMRVYNSLDSFLLLAVPFFLLAGNLMNETGVTQRLIRFCYAVIGHFRGGLAYINILVSMLFAGISGSSTADTAGIGSVLIPVMKEKGYDPSFSVAITVASSVMGAIIPPSLVLVVWGAITNTSVALLFAGGIIPGILIGLVQMAQVAYFGRKRGFPVEPRRGLGEIIASFRSAFFAFLTPIFIVGGIVFGFVTPTEASVIAVLYSLFLGFVIYRSLCFRDLPRVLFESARLVSLSLFCLGAAGIFGWLLAYYDVPKMLAGAASQIPNRELLLISIALIYLLLGTFLDALVVAIIIAPLFLPAVQDAGIHLVQYGVVSTVALSMGLITPPYGLCLLLGASIGEIPQEKALPDTMKLFGMMCLVLLAIILFPDLSLFLPKILAGQWL
jgi:tripartite ATP-independent transporter DctM subunit